MEISALFAPIWRQKWFIILFGILGSITLTIYSQFLSTPNYYAHVFFTVAYRDEQRTPDDYAYANYYGNYASIEFARTVSAWPKDPHFIKEVYDDAGVDRDTDQGLVDQLLGNLSVTAQERANLRVNIRSRSEENLRKLTASFTKILRERLDNYNRQSATQYQLININSTPFITYLQPNEAWPLGLALGLILGLVWSYIWETWQGKLATAQQLQDTLAQSLFWEKKGSGNNMSPISTLLKSWDKDILVVSNRASQKKFIRALLRTNVSAHIVSSEAEQLKSYLPKNSTLTITTNQPTSKKATKVLNLVNFPEDSNALVDMPQASLLIVAQRGRSRIHELQSLNQLTQGRVRAVVLI